MRLHASSGLCRSAFGLALALSISAGAPVTAAERPAIPRVAMSMLGDLTPFRTIASDTLVIVDRGDIPAARTRVKDLETSWDNAEATLKPKDRATWTMIDKMIDDALVTLRMPAPKPAACVESLKALIAKMDAIDNA